jgi:hypothetical protein
MKENFAEEFVKNVVPRVPSENIFAKDPSELVE